ncbi:hypothetical protein [Morganella morganii]|uniref:hypothetical protein n=1 Tax=Morganella morganii TaxID=582 RepID=UPI001EDCEC55|nr:hypothetical protein [Morganella morganii]
MLNKTTCHLYLSDDEIYNQEDVCRENDLLSEYLTRQQTDNLKKQIGSAAERNGIFLFSTVT